MSALAKRLREAREEAGLSQVEIGAACDPPVSGQAVYKWEKGLAQPNSRNLDIVAQLTGKTLKWFLYGVEYIPNDGNLAHAGRAGRIVPSVDSDNIIKLLAGDSSVILGGVRSNFPCSERAFQTFVKDDANAPDLMTGDSIIVDPERPPQPGKLCMAVHNGEPVIRRYRRRRDHVELAPVNSDWDVLEVKQDDIVGAVTEITKPH